MKSSPRSEDLAACLETELQRGGVTPEKLLIYSTAAQYWAFRLEVGGHRFWAGVNHQGLYCWDMSAGNEKNLIPPGVGPIFGDPFDLSRNVARLVVHALRHLEFAFGEPQIL